MCKKIVFFHVLCWLSEFFGWFSISRWTLCSCFQSTECGKVTLLLLKSRTISYCILYIFLMLTEKIVPKILTSVRFSLDFQQILFSEFPVASVQNSKQVINLLFCVSSDKSSNLKLSSEQNLFIIFLLLLNAAISDYFIFRHFFFPLLILIKSVAWIL